MASLSKDELLKLIGDHSEDGVKKLLETFYGDEWEKAIGKASTKKVINSIAGIFWAHIKAPLLVMDGDAKDAVDSLVGAIGTLAGGIIGGPVGLLVGGTISIGPGLIIDYFDTTTIQCNVMFLNTSPYHIRFSSGQTDYNYNWSIMKAYLPGIPNQYTYNAATGVLSLPSSCPFLKSYSYVHFV
jgi:hypothetical protein